MIASEASLAAVNEELPSPVTMERFRPNVVVSGLARFEEVSFCHPYMLCVKYRFRTGPGKPGKPWNFIMPFSRTGKSWKKATGPGKFWKSVKLN